MCIVMPVHWSDTMGGAEYQMKLLTDALVKEKNLQISVLCRRAGSGFRQDGCDVIRISKERRLHKYGEFVDSLSLLRALKRIRPDVIYQRVGCAYTGVAAYYARKTGCRMIWHISSDNGLSGNLAFWKLKPHIFIEKALMLWGVKNSPIIVAQSVQQREMVKRLNRKARIDVIRNFHPFPNGTDPKNKADQIVWVGNIKGLKQPELYFDLAEGLLREEIRAQCMMIGALGSQDWKYQEVLEKRIKAAPNVKYLGKLEQEKVNEIVGASKLLINTSKWEGFPNTFIQAWMRRTPVVSLTCDPDEVITKKKLGLVSGSVERLVQDVSYLLRNEAERVQMGANGQRYAFENFSMKNLENLKELILEDLQSDRSS
jgi:glycosyltransferase involved in cell wall biosynthesis